MSYLSAIILRLAEWEEPDESDYDSNGHLVVIAIECYFTVLAIPRAAAYNAYHPVLFDHSIAITSKILHTNLGHRTKKAIEDRIFPVLGKLFKEFLLPAEHANRPINDLFTISEYTAKNQMKCTDLVDMFVALFGQKLLSIILPNMVRLLNGKWFAASVKGTKQNLKVWD